MLDYRAVLECVLGGGNLLGWGKLVLDRQYKQQRLRIDQEEKQQKLRMDQEEKNRSLDEKELEKCRKRISDLEEKILQLEVAILPSSYPEWRKDVSGRYQYVSAAFTLAFLVPMGLGPDDIMGKTDGEAFGKFPEFVDTLIILDKRLTASVSQVAVGRRIAIPGTGATYMVIKELVSDPRGHVYRVGRAYPEPESKFEHVV